MITSDIIFKEILDKLVFLTGNEFLLINNFEEQLTAIRKNFIEAGLNYKNSKKEWSADELYNTILKEFYKPTNTLLEKTLLLRNKDKYPYGFQELMNDNGSIEGISLSLYRNVFYFLESFKKFLELEDLKNIKYYQINIFKDNYIIDYKKNTFIKGMPEDRFNIKLFLISNDRILILEQDNDQLPRNKKDFEWKLTRMSRELLLKKDIKQVGTCDDQVSIHIRNGALYFIHMESLEKAIELRKIINKLRE